MSNASACSTGTQLYVFCSSEIKHCCTNSTNEACYDNPYYDCPRVPPYYNQFSEDWNASSLKIECQVYTPFLVCDKLWASYNDCCNSDSHKCVCPQGEAPSQSVSFYLSTESKPQSAATTSPHVIESSGLSSTTTSTAGPFGAQIPPARPSVLSSARLATPLATPTGRQDLQNSRAAPKANTAAVAGGIAGGIIGLALLLAVLAICYRRRPTRPLKNTDQGKLPRWGAGQARAIGAGGGELEEIKQGPSPTSSLLRPPSSWPLPQPPSYTPYRSHDNELDKSPPSVPQPVASLPHTSNNHPSPESPPSPPPSNTRSSQYSADHDSEAESVSPISSHYQRHPFDEEGGVKASVYSDISSNDLFQNQNMRS